LSITYPNFLPKLKIININIYDDDFVKIKIDTLKNNGYNIPSNLKLYTTWKSGEFVIFSDETIDQYQKRLKEEQFDL